MMKLNTFQIVRNQQPISPWLTTTKEYGRFFLGYFNDVINDIELFKQESKNGEPLRVYHPGSKIGKYFDSNKFDAYDLQSWFFKSDSAVLKKLYKYQMAEPTDLNFIKTADGREMMLRGYTPRMIELYIQTMVDSKFEISNLVLPPKQVVIKDTDTDSIIMPAQKKKNRLF